MIPPILKEKLQWFATLAQAAGWEYCGVQDAMPPALPSLMVTKKNTSKFIPCDPNDFDPIKTATLFLVPEEKKMTETNKPTTALNLRQKLIQIYTEIDHIEKSGDNRKQNYKFVKAADVLRAIRAAFAKFGVYAETNFELLGTYDIKTNSGGNMHTATVKATIVLFDADSDETKTISGLGDGADGGDKGIYKAQTGAVKNALRNGTLLPDEADPEADENVDDRTTGAYTHPASTTDMPDFQEAQHAAPRPAQPKDAPLPPPTPPVPAEKQNQGPAVAPEHGDAYEGPDDDGALPTEEQFVTYRENFTKLANELSAKGKLTASAGLKLNRKLLVFLIQITKATDAQHITRAQWDNFFARVKAAAENPEVGLVGLAKLVNKANGIENKK